MGISENRRILAASTSAFAGVPLERALMGVVEAGFEYVEIACLRGSIEHLQQSQMTISQAREVKTMLRHWGLKSVALSAHMNLTLDGAVGDFAQRMRFAQALEVKSVITNISTRESRSVFVANLKSLLPMAADMGLMIGIESPGHLLTARTEYEELLAELDSPLVGLNFDIGNVFTASLGTADSMEDLVPLLDSVCQFHIKDVSLQGDIWSFTPLGEGELPYGEILSMITGYKRQIPIAIEMPLSLEGKGRAPAYLTSREIPYNQIVQSLKASREFAEKYLYGDI